MKTASQTELMSWIKTEHVDFYLGFHKFLSEHFSFCGVKQVNGEYVWFCVMNESCQAGMLLDYIANVPKTESIESIKNRCFEILHIIPKKEKPFNIDLESLSPEKRIEILNSDL